MVGLMFIVCFLILEYAVGQFYYSNIHQISYKMFDPQLGWRLKPGTYWIKPPHTFTKFSFYINKYGLRNRDITTIQEKGIKRIIILGDSFTFGEVIRNKDIFSIQLERILKKNYSNKYEIINAGVPGYGTAQELLFMKKLSDNNITGDIYLLIIFTNDILDNLCLDYGNRSQNSVQPGFVLGSNDKIELRYLPVNKTSNNLENFIPVRKKPKNTKIIEVLKRKVESFLQTKPVLVKVLSKLGFNVKFPRMPGLLNGWYEENVLEAGIPLMKALIKEIKNETEIKNAKLLISIIPSPIQVYPDVYGNILKKTFPDSKQVDNWLKNMTKPQTIIREICEKLDIPFLDLYPILYKNSDKELFIPREGHLNRTGHTIVAHNLAKFIIENDK